MTRKKHTYGLRLRTRGGAAIQKRWTRIMIALKAPHSCPSCASLKVAREAVGIWECREVRIQVRRRSIRANNEDRPCFETSSNSGLNKGLILFSPQRVKAEIKISVPQNMGNVIVSSLRPELATPTSDRSEVSINPTTSGILITIEAEDITALRAAANSYLYWYEQLLRYQIKLQKKKLDELIKCL